MTEVGYASLAVIPSFRGFDNNLERGIAGPMDAAGRTAGSRFGSAFRTVARASLFGAIGGGALAIKLGSDAIELASSLAESQNKVNVVFGEGAAVVEDYAASAFEFGQSTQEALEAAGTFGNLFVNMGVGEQRAAKMSVTMTKLGADLASFNNIESTDALERLRSGLLGEQEAVERLGISLTEAGLKQRAFDMGLVDSTTGVLPAAVRTQAAYAEILAQTGLAQGDFARTSDGLANRQRILNARWDDARAKLGTALLPAMEGFVGFVIDEGIPAFEKFSGWFVDDGIPALKDVAEFGGDAANVLGDIVGFLNDLPTEAKLAGLAGILAGGTALKLGGGNGLTGGVGSALGLARPVPVLVTNPGFGAPGTGPATGGKGSSGSRGAGLLAAAPLVPEIVEEFKYPFTAEGQQAMKDTASGFGQLGIPRLLTEDYEADLDFMTDAADDATTAINLAFSTLPKRLVTKFQTDGVPQSIGQAQSLVKQFNLTPKEKRTLFELLGYNTLMSQIQRINSSLDYASRDRRTAITVAYANAGYDTKGGIPEGGGGPVSPRATQRTIDADRRFHRRLDDRD